MEGTTLITGGHGKTLVGKARQFAIEAHDGQTYGPYPYYFHLDQVFRLLLQAGRSGPILPAAFLHDVLEDTSATVAQVRDLFGVEVFELVWAVTGIGANRRERNADIYRKLALLPPARDLKLADRLANLSCSDQKPGLRQMYLREHPEFLAAVEGADPWLLDQYLAQIRMEPTTNGLA